VAGEGRFKAVRFAKAGPELRSVVAQLSILRSFFREAATALGWLTPQTLAAICSGAANANDDRARSNQLCGKRND